MIITRILLSVPFVLISGTPPPNVFIDRLRYFSENVKKLLRADESDSQAQIDEASRLSLTRQALSFAKNEMREFDILVQHVGLANACRVSIRDYDDITWSAIRMICTEVETRPSTPSAGSPSLRTSESVASAALEPQLTSEEVIPSNDRKRKVDLQIDTGLSPTADTEVISLETTSFECDDDFKRRRVDDGKVSDADGFDESEVVVVDSNRDEKAVRSRLKRYGKLKPMSKKLVTDGMRYVAFIQARLAEAGKFNDLLQNLNMLEVTGADEQIIAYVFHKANVILKSPESASAVNLDELIDEKKRESILECVHRGATETSFKAELRRFCLDPRLVSPRSSSPLEGKRAKISSWFLRKVKGEDYASAQRTLDFLYYCKVDVKNIADIVRETCLYLKGL